MAAVVKHNVLYRENILLALIYIYFNYLGYLFYTEFVIMNHFSLVYYLFFQRKEYHLFYFIFVVHCCEVDIVGVGN